VLILDQGGVMTGIQPELWVESPREALGFYEAAFGATVLHCVGDGDDIVAQLGVGEAAFWVAPASASMKRLSPRAIDGATSRTLLVVEDPDTVVGMAVAAGATETSPVGDEHGWRLGRIVDPFGQEWEIGTPRADSRMVVSDVLAFVRANLPPPPARVLEVGAGDGELAAALASAGYEVVAIDPVPAGTNVRACALHALDEPAASFDAAIAIVSLHHVDPLAGSLRRLAEVLKPAATVLVDEFDVAAFDVSAAAWWLERQHALSAKDAATAEELVDEHRAHLHPLHRIAAALEARFHVGLPVRGAYLYRWDLGESFRKEEENSIARAQIPAVGARLVALRTP
jgi:PhnB protein